MRPIDEIIIHCAATRPEWMAKSRTSRKVAEIRKWHKARGWRDIGYHLVIDRDGTVADGRPMDQTGAHVKGHNTGTIGVCLIGGHGAAANDRFEDHFTPEQETALMITLGNLKAAYGKRLQTGKPGGEWVLKVSGHNEYANKGCPGFNVSKWLAEDIPDDTLTPPESPRSPDDPGGRSARSLLDVLAALFSKLWKRK